MTLSIRENVVLTHKSKVLYSSGTDGTAESRALTLVSLNFRATAGTIHR